MGASLHRPEYRAMAQRLRRAREESGLLQAQVARRLKRPQSYVSKCESGEHRVDLIELCAFALVYKRPLTYFVPAELGVEIGAYLQDLEKREKRLQRKGATTAAAPKNGGE